MPNGLLCLALGAVMQVGSPGPSENPFTPAPPTAYGQYGSEGSSEPRFPFDTPRNWVHGYYQELPAYGGYPVFRPYNYKHVLSQSQTAAGWGERPMMPYSQQFWHKYHDQATMLKTTQQMPMRAAPTWNASYQPAMAPVQTQGSWSGSPVSTNGMPISAPSVSTGYQSPPQNISVMPEQPQIQLPPVQSFSPATYQPGFGRGF